MKKDLFNKSSARHGLILFGHRSEEERERLREQFLEKAGDFMESKVGERIENSRYEAPELSPEAATSPAALSSPGVWYRLPIPEGLSGDGSEYHIYVRRGRTDHLCVFLSGGGVAWNAYTASHPITTGRIFADAPNYYWSNLRPVTQLMNIHLGITSNAERNPFHDWNFIVITYSTGDFHVGESDFHYETEDGKEEVLHFVGHRNFRASMDRAVRLFPSCTKLLIAGNSAGAFAVPALAGEIADDYYPMAEDVTLLSDSGQLIYRHWKHTARDLWKTKENIWKAIHSENITLDWYEMLMRRNQGRFRCLYASSTRDYVLSAYYNDVTTKTYKTDAEVQEIFYEQLKEMVKSLRDICPGISFFINDWTSPLTRGGTIHTVVREPYFLLPQKQSGVSMAKWLIDAIGGKRCDIGMELL